MTPNQIFRIDFDDLNNYLAFGYNGSGDPICFDIINSYEIVYLNHDDNFKKVFINKSILQFADCLIKYRDFILSLTDDSNIEFIRRKFSDIELGELKNSFQKIDSYSLSNNSFWANEFANLLLERDNQY